MKEAIRVGLTARLDKYRTKVEKAEKYLEDARREYNKAITLLEEFKRIY